MGIDLKSVKDGFHGTVLLKEFFRNIDGVQYLGVTGIVSIHNDKDAVGFQTRGQESNWLAAVQGEKANYYFLGCQIRGFIEHEDTEGKDARHLEFLRA